MQKLDLSKILIILFKKKYQLYLMIFILEVQLVKYFKH